MAINLKFNLSISDDLKYLIISDESSNYEDGISYGINNINVTTSLAGLWEDPVNSDAGAFIDVNTGEEVTGSLLTSGLGIQVAASDIFNDSSAFIYDNIYTITIQIEDSEYNTINYSVTKVLYPLSHWYKNNITANYDYHNEDIDQMMTIIKYQTWLYILNTASTYGDDGTISVILKSFKRLIDGYGLPG